MISLFLMHRHICLHFNFLLFGSHFIKLFKDKVFVKNLNFIILYLQPDVNHQVASGVIFYTLIIWSNNIHSLNYIGFTTLGCNDIRIRKLEFVTNGQLLYVSVNVLNFPYFLHMKKYF